MSVRKVDEKVFERIKTLQKGGLSTAEIAESLQLGKSTVGFARKANSFEEYNNIIIENRKKTTAYKTRKHVTPMKKHVKEPAPQVVEHHQTISLVANQYLMEQLRKQTELLTLINNKLTLIAEDLGCFRNITSEENVGG